MDRFLKLSGVILYIFIVVKYWPYLFSQISFWLLYILALIGLIAVVILILYTLFKKNFLFEKTNNLIFGKGLIDSIKTFLDELPKVSNNTIANLLGHIAFRFIRIGIFASLIAILPILLLMQQNRLLGYQNELVKHQNKQIENQNQLIEGQRRSSLMLLFGNIVNMLDNDLKENKERNLSEQTISSIISLSKGLKPYHQLEDSVLSKKSLSPERGQLLLLLTSSQINQKSLDKIFLKADFTNSDLRRANLENAYLKNCNLENSELHLSNLSKVNFENAILRSACLRQSNVGSTNFSNAELSYAIFDNALFSDSTKLDNSIVDNKNWFNNIIMDEYSSIIYFNSICNKYGIDSTEFTLFGENKILLSGYRVINLDKTESLLNIKLFPERQMLTPEKGKLLREKILSDTNLSNSLYNTN